jgi:hypothetical protein
MSEAGSERRDIAVEESIPHRRRQSANVFDGALPTIA